VACDWWDLPGAPPQYATRRNPNRETWGPEVAKVMRKLGFDPMPWQQYVLDVTFEHEDGELVYNNASAELVYRDITELVPRQAGKTAKVLGVQVHRATTMRKRFKRRQTSLYTAQRWTDARIKLLEEHVPTIEASPYGRFIDPHRSTGAEGITWSNGSEHHIAAPTEKAGHGLSLDLAQIDEAFVLESELVEQGIKPTQITRPSPQFYVISAAGTPKSTYLRQRMELGREHVRHGIDSGTAYFEWSADGLDVDPMDPAVWRATHPAIGFTITEKALAADAKTMKPDEFARAYLAIWQTKAKPKIVREEDWEACADESSACGDQVCFAIDVSPQRDMAAVSVAGRRPDGLLHIEVLKHDHGTAWIIDYVQGLLARHKRATLSVDTVGSASSLLPALERRKVPVRLLTTSDVARSMGLLLDAIGQGKLRHRDQLALNVALAGADKRRIGDKWAWARGDSDITPLVSATLALWSLETTVEPRKFKMGLAV